MNDGYGNDVVGILRVLGCHNLNVPLDCLISPQNSLRQGGGGQRCPATGLNLLNVFILKCRKHSKMQYTQTFYHLYSNPFHTLAKFRLSVTNTGVDFALQTTCTIS